MIEVSNLSKIFNLNLKNELKALNGVTLSINNGEIFGILGPNGAGKTTFLRILSTVLSPTEGEAIINNFHVRDQQEKVKKSIGFLSGNTKLYGRLTPRELLTYFGKLYDIKKIDVIRRIEEISEVLKMNDFLDQPIEKLSTGQTQRTSIARCVFHEPEVYILDEPTLGLDIFSSRTILEFVKTKAREGKTILFSTHYMEEAEYLCDRVALIHQGRILDIATINELKANSKMTNLTDIFLHYINSH